MRIKMLKIDESEYWADETRHKVKRIWGVYIFDPNWRVHLCEFTPSYELHRLPSQVEFLDHMDDATIQLIEDEVREVERFDDPITYMHCHRIDGAGSYKEGWFPHEKLGTCTMTGFATYLPRSRTISREERHDAAIEEAVEYCQQNCA